MLIKQGNAIHMAESGEFDILMHGCNCMGVMGGGIARSIATLWPEALKADLKATTRDRSMLGSYSVAQVPLGLYQDDLLIVNAYTQFAPGRGEDVFEYDAFAEVLDRIALDYPTAIVGMPAIGCGLAGGDKARILQIIRDSLLNDRVVFVEFG